MPKTEIGSEYFLSRDNSQYNPHLDGTLRKTLKISGCRRSRYEDFLPYRAKLLKQLFPCMEGKVFQQKFFILGLCKLPPHSSFQLQSHCGFCSVAFSVCSSPPRHPSTDQLVRPHPAAVILILHVLINHDKPGLQRQQDFPYTYKTLGCLYKI